jgi:hypothetical protein
MCNVACAAVNEHRIKVSVFENLPLHVFVNFGFKCGTKPCSQIYGICPQGKRRSCPGNSFVQSSGQPQ